MLQSVAVCCSRTSSGANSSRMLVTATAMMMTDRVDNAAVCCKGFVLECVDVCWSVAGIWESHGDRDKNAFRFFKPNFLHTRGDSNRDDRSDVYWIYVHTHAHTHKHRC